jgi:hypothetical protein
MEVTAPETESEKPNSGEELIIAGEEDVLAQLDACKITPSQKTPRGQNLSGSRPPTPEPQMERMETTDTGEVAGGLPPPPQFVTLIDYPVKSSAVEVGKNEDGSIEYHYRGLVEGAGEYYHNNDIRHATMTAQEFNSKLDKGLNLLHRSKGNDVLKARMEESWQNFIREGVVGNPHEYTYCKHLLFGGIPLTARQMFLLADPLRVQSRDFFADNPDKNSIADYVDLLVTGGASGERIIQSIAKSIWFTWDFFYTIALSWDRDQIEAEVTMLFVERHFLTIDPGIQFLKSWGVDLEKMSEYSVRIFELNEDVNYDLHDISSPRIDSDGRHFDIHTEKELNPETGALLYSDEEEEETNVLDLNIDQDDLEVLNQGLIDEPDQVMRSVNDDEEESVEEIGTQPSVEPTGTQPSVEEPMQEDEQSVHSQAESHRSRAGSGGSRASRVASPRSRASSGASRASKASQVGAAKSPEKTKSPQKAKSPEKKKPESDYTIRNLKGTEYVELTKGGKVVKIHVPHEDEMIHGITAKGFYSRQYQRDSLKLPDAPKPSKIDCVNAIIKYQTKIPLTFKEEYYIIAHKLVDLKLPQRELDEPISEYADRKLLDSYKKLGMSCSVKFKIRLQNLKKAGKKLTTLEEYLLENPVDNTNIPKAVYDNIRDRRPQSEPEYVDLISEDPQTPTDREPDPALVEKIKEQASKQAELELANLKKQMAEAHAQQAAELYVIKKANEAAEAKIKRLKEAERKATEEAARQKKEADKALAIAAAKSLAETVDVAAQQQRAESEVRSTTDAKYRAALEQARALRLEVLVNDLDQIRENAGVPDRIRAQLEKEDEEGYYSPPTIPKYIRDGFPEDRNDPENQENWTFALDQYRKQNLGYVKDRMKELNRLKAQGKPIKSFKDRYYLTVYWEEVEYRMNQCVRKAQKDLGDYFLPPHKRDTRKLTVPAKLKELAEEHMQPTAPRGEASGAASVIGSEASSMLPSKRAVPHIEGFRFKLPKPLSKDPAESSLSGLDEEISKALTEKFGETTPASSRIGMFISSSTPEEDLEAAKFGMQPRATYLMPDTNLKLPVTSKVQGCDIPTVEEFVASHTNPNAPTSESVTIDPTYCGHCGSVDGTHCDCSKHQCVYPPCEDFKKHSIYLCPTLMSRCGRCMLRGHTEVMCLRYTLHQWIYVYNCYLHMNILTHDVVNNVAMTVYPFP